MNVFRETGEKVLAVGVEPGGLVLVFVGGVDDRCVKFPSGYDRQLVTCARGSYLRGTYEVAVRVACSGHRVVMLRLLILEWRT